MNAVNNAMNSAMLRAMNNAMNDAMNNVMRFDGPADLPASDSLEILAFRLGQLQIGIDMRLVQELRPYADAGRIADGDVLLEGVIVSRGVIMPVFDMRARTAAAAEAAAFPVLIVLNLMARTVGMVVDQAIDMMVVQTDDVTPALSSAGVEAPDYLIGVCVVDAHKLILVDVEKLMADAVRGLAV